MTGLPIELVLVVLFGIAMLLNFVKQQAARRRRAEASQADAEQEAEDFPEQVWRTQAAAELPPPASAGVARPQAEARTEMPGRPGRRFARQTLLGSRRKVQDAFVLAAILGPCRGDEPHDMG